MGDVFRVLVQLKTDLFVPLRVLPTTFDRLSPSFLAIEDYLTVRVLLSYVSFVWEIPLGDGNAG